MDGMCIVAALDAYNYVGAADSGCNFICGQGVWIYNDRFLRYVRVAGAPVMPRRM